MAVNVLSLCHVRETSPGTHTFFPTYTCPVYCWRSVQLLDFGLYCNLIHASQPIRTTFTGQWFASSFLQTPPHDDALAFGCTLPTAGRVRDFHPLERVPAGHTIEDVYTKKYKRLFQFSSIHLFEPRQYLNFHFDHKYECEYNKYHCSFHVHLQIRNNLLYFHLFLPAPM